MQKRAYKALAYLTGQRPDYALPHMAEVRNMFLALPALLCCAFSAFEWYSNLLRSRLLTWQGMSCAGAREHADLRIPFFALHGLQGSNYADC